jgi:hypothetical protein
MRRIYKVLIPFYRKAEVETEIANDWLFDCGGRSNLDYTLISLVLFRIAH